MRVVSQVKNSAYRNGYEPASGTATHVRCGIPEIACSSRLAHVTPFLHRIRDLPSHHRSDATP